MGRRFFLHYESLADVSFDLKRHESRRHAVARFDPAAERKGLVGMLCKNFRSFFVMGEERAK